jgi:DNA repair exonuclease SbcCD ATPase subunit
MVKIVAPSGHGKTNVMKALMWALFGKVSAPVKYGEEGCSVGVSELIDLDIKRSKNPNLLAVDNATNSTAQAFIETELGMCYDEFMASSYVMQDQKNSLLSLSPSEQLDMIFALAFKNKDPEDVKRRIKDKISDLAVSMDNRSFKISVASKEIEYADCEIKNQTSLLNVIDEDKDVLVPMIEELNAKITAITDRRRVITDEKVALHSLRLSGERARYLASVKQYENLKSQVAELESWMSKNPPGSVLLNKKLTEEVDQLSEELKILKHKKERYEIALNQSRNKSLTESKYVVNLGHLKKMCDDIVKSENVTEFMAQEVCTASELYIASLNAYQMCSSTSEVTEDPTDKYNEIKLRYDVVKSQLSSVRDKDAVYKSKTEEMASKTKLLESCAETISSGASKFLSEEELSKKLSKINDEESLCTDEIVNVSSQKNSLQARLNKILDNEKIHKVIADAKKRKASAEERSAKEEILHANDMRLFKKLNRVMELANKAALDSVEATIDSINANAEYWLTEMFDGKLTATLETSKEFKSNKPAADKLNILIHENGQKIDKKEDLSGGQQSRLCLAFQLALSEIYDSPILMLDEAFKGLDRATMRICLNSVKRISENKLVLVSEHFADETLFDEVITL